MAAEKHCVLRSTGRPLGRVGWFVVGEFDVCMFHVADGGLYLGDGVRGRSTTCAEPAATRTLRALGNRLVGIVDGCLRPHQKYEEIIAWPDHSTAAA